MTVLIFFWISISALFYCYIGYGLILFCFNLTRRLITQDKPSLSPADWPRVTIIVTAYNEGTFLYQKLRNTLEIDYPGEKLEIIFITDGSTDGSEKIIHEHAGVVLLHQSQRQGKLAAMTRAMNYVKSPIVVFSDANSLLNKECLKRLVLHYNNKQIGGVAGEKKIISNTQLSAIGEAEGLYWKYESFMKKQDARFNSVAGAAGELFSIRTELFEPPPRKIILDDFVISMKICLKGYKMKYEPGAFASELPSVSLKEETKRKIRIAAGAWQSIGYLKEALNFFSHPVLWFQYVSRRLLRWTICPWMLVVLLITNIILVTYSIAPVYSWFLCGQVLFYTAAIAGGWLLRSGNHIGILAIPFYFLFMNYCLVRGLVRFLRGRQTVLWEKAVREVA